jgi:hypothetical protein
MRKLFTISTIHKDNNRKSLRVLLILLQIRPYDLDLKRPMIHWKERGKKGEGLKVQCISQNVSRKRIKPVKGNLVESTLL